MAKLPLKNRSLPRITEELHRVIDYSHSLQISARDTLFKGEVVAIINGTDVVYNIGRFISHVDEEGFQYDTFDYLGMSMGDYGAKYVDIQWVGTSDMVVDMEILTRSLRKRISSSIILILENGVADIRMMGDDMIGIPAVIPGNIKGIIVRYNAGFLFTLPGDFNPGLIGMDVAYIEDILLSMITREFDTPPSFRSMLSGGRVIEIKLSDEEGSVISVDDEGDMRIYYVGQGEMDVNIRDVAELISTHGIYNATLRWIIPEGIIMDINSFHGETVEDAYIGNGVDHRYLIVEVYPEFILQGG
jgi:hypothetical protein